MKPDWKTAPEWANYLACDYNGRWYWYELEPQIVVSCNLWASFHVKWSFICESGTVNEKWKESLEKRPEED